MFDVFANLSLGSRTIGLQRNSLENFSTRRHLEGLEAAPRDLRAYTSFGNKRKITIFLRISLNFSYLCRRNRIDGFNDKDEVYKAFLYCGAAGGCVAAARSLTKEICEHIITTTKELTQWIEERLPEKKPSKQ